MDLALANVEEGGKPFACIVVDSSTGEVLHEATNQVAQSGDLTAHAEITAIRELAAKGRAHLSGCDVYVTAYPCPMCLGALYYAAPERVVYAASAQPVSLGFHPEARVEFFADVDWYDTGEAGVGRAIREGRPRGDRCCLRLSRVMGDLA